MNKLITRGRYFAAKGQGDGEENVGESGRMKGRGEEAGLGGGERYFMLS